MPHNHFQDRLDAGRQLASRLLDLGPWPGTTVLALPRGGVPVAAGVARALGAPLDVFLVHKVCRALEAEADEVICLLSPPNSMAVGQFYADFHQTTDREVQALLAQACSQAQAVPETQPSLHKESPHAPFRIQTASGHP